MICIGLGIAYTLGVGNGASTKGGSMKWDGLKTAYTVWVAVYVAVFAVVLSVL